MASRNNAGWLVLVAALAVPGFMFFQWWTSLNSASKADLQKKVRKRLPDGQVFNQPPAKEKLDNPMKEGAGGVPAAPAAPAAPAVAGAPAPSANLAGQPQGTAPVTAVAPGANAEGDHPSEPVGVLTTGPIGQIVLTRDPMLSPYDVVRIAEAEERARKAREDLERERNRARQPKRRAVVQQVDPRTLVDLQGIVSNDEGDKAIVNGEMVGEGDMVGQIRILKISPTSVVFQYGKQRFSKGISK